MYHYKVIEMYGPFCKPSYGIQAEVAEDGICTYVAFIPDISCNKAFVDELAQKCTKGQLSPMHLLEVVLDALS